MAEPLPIPAGLPLVNPPPAVSENQDEEESPSVAVAADTSDDQ